MEPTRFDTQKVEHQKQVVICSLYWILVGAGTIFALYYVLPVLLPFVIAYLIAGLLEKPIQKVKQKLPLPRMAISILMILTFILIGGGALFMLTMTLVSWIRSGLNLMPDVMEQGIMPFFAGLFDGLEQWFLNLNAGMASVLETTMDSIYSALQEGGALLINKLLSLLGGLLSGIPSIIMKTLVTMVACIFISADFQKVKHFVFSVIPKRWHPVIQESKHFFGRTVPRFFGSYLMIFLLTMTELTIGLTIGGVPGAGALSVIIAMLDILPILGTGTVLIPWGLVNIFAGSVNRGIYLLVLYGVIMVIRNILEPKLIGHQIKLHPVLTLMGLIIGARFFGFVGLIGAPLMLAFIKELHENKILQLPFLVERAESEKGEKQTDDNA